MSHTLCTRNALSRMLRKETSKDRRQSFRNMKHLENSEECILRSYLQTRSGEGRVCHFIPILQRLRHPHPIVSVSLSDLSCHSRYRPPLCKPSQIVVSGLDNSILVLLLNIIHNPCCLFLCCYNCYFYSFYTRCLEGSRVRGNSTVSDFGASNHLQALSTNIQTQ